MRTAAKQKGSKSGLKIKRTVKNPEDRLTDMSEAGNSGTRRTVEESVEARLSAEGITNEEKFLLIAKAAYFRSEKRRFAPGCELEDWLAAEVEIEKKLLEVGSQTRS
jgi:hypothetical protein